jgi:hypothetical protein
LSSQNERTKLECCGPSGRWRHKIISLEQNEPIYKCMYFATHPSTILLIFTSCYTCIPLWKNPIQRLQGGGTKDSKLTPYPIHEESHVSPSDSDSSLSSLEETLKKFYRQSYHEEDANSPDRYYKGRVAIYLSISTSCCRCCCYWAVANS